MARFAIAARPALLIAGGVAVAAAVGVGVVRFLRRRARAEAEELLPRVDVAAYNDALLAP